MNTKGNASENTWRNILMYSLRWNSASYSRGNAWEIARNIRRGSLLEVLLKKSVKTCLQKSQKEVMVEFLKKIISEKVFCRNPFKSSWKYLWKYCQEKMYTISDGICTQKSIEYLEKFLNTEEIKKIEGICEIIPGRTGETSKCIHGKNWKVPWKV